MAERECSDVDEHLGDLIDGVAEDELYDHLASCERCRDVRFEAERLSLLVAEAASDYRFPEQLAEHLTSAIDALPARPSQRPWAAALARVSQSLRPGPPASGEPARAEPHAEPHATEPHAEPHATEPRPAEPARPPRPADDGGRPSARWAWLSLAAAVGLGGVWLAARRGPGDAAPPAHVARAAGAWQGQVVGVERAPGSPTGLAQCARGTQVCQPIGPGDIAHAGMRLETDGLTRARLQLADGSTLALDRSTRFELDPSERRRGRLVTGSVVAEIEAELEPVARVAAAGAPGGAAGADPPGSATAVRAVIDVPFGRAEVLGTKLSLRTSDAGTRVEVSRGSVKLIEDEQGRSAFVNAGEAALLTSGAAPRVEAASDLGGALEWSTSAFEARTDAPRGALGSLVARRPSDGRELGDAVRLASHHVRARIVDNIARTEVEEVFESSAGEVLGGTFSFPLPPGAALERLALEVDGQLHEGAFVERGSDADGAQPQGEGAPAAEPGPWRDPTLLEWQRGARIELPIATIPPRGRRRVVLAYSERLAPGEGQRHYVYPLPSAPRGGAPVGRFSVDVQVRGHDAARAVTASGYPLTPQGGPPEVARLGFEEEGFVPRGDLSVSYSLAASGELRALAYQPESAAGPPDESGPGERELPADAPFVAITLRPELPRRTRYDALDYVLVADTSRSMFGERQRQATRVIARLAGELDRSARVAVLGCDSTCQALPGGFLAPGEAAADAARRFLEGIEPEGASDLALAVESAAALRPRARRDAPAQRALRVIYVGDGTPTVGPISPALLEPAIAAALPLGGSLSAIAVGSDAERGALGVAARAGGGVVFGLTPGVSVDDVVYAVLGTTYGQTLTSARVELPEGLVHVSPKKLGSIAAGSEQVIVGRMTRQHVGGPVVLHGQLAGEPFERRYSLEVSAEPGEAQAFVARLYASVALAELEAFPDEAARRRSVELSTRHAVPSRYTSLQVLGSPALGAFGASPLRGAPSGEARAAPGAGNAGEVAVIADSDGAAPAPGAEPAPMRRVWQRVGTITVPPAPLPAASDERRQTLARLAEEQPESPAALRSLYAASSLAGDLEAAAAAAERWATLAPLDVDALLARADVAAQRGERERAVRALGSVVDLRPADEAAQWRLARLHRWAGQPQRGCRHALAVAELRSNDAQLVSDGIGCARDAGDDASADLLLASLTPGVRSEVERLARKRRSSDGLSGDLRVSASWSGGKHDLDLVLLYPDGARASWLGGPASAVISATDAVELGREGLALRGAPPGQYAVELVRSSPTTGPVRGTVRIQAAGSERSVPFSLDGERARVATIELRREPRLVPIESGGDPRWE